MIRNITIENVGPIEKLCLPLPDAGVVVLHGRNGCGKSHALAAVDSLVSGRGRPPCRDGAARGVIDGLGARLTIGRSQRRTGEAEVVTLEGRLDISQLVQPPIKDEESADRTRIKALIQLAGAAADPGEFASILPAGTRLGELVPLGEQTDDPVILAGRVKRALEAEARRAERRAEEARSRAAAIVAQLPTGVPTDVGRAQAEAEFQEALLNQRELQTRAEEARRREAQIQKARQALVALRACDAREDVDALAAEAEGLDEQIGKLQRALDVARERRLQVRKRLDQARTVAAQIEQLEKLVAETPAAPPAEELDAAVQRVERARQRHQQALEAERGRKLTEECDRHWREAAEAEAEAKSFREAAAATDEVLTGMVARVTSRLRVEAGRLVCDTDRGAEPFGELSPGERWRIALEIAAEQVGHGGLVTVPQEAWESLDPVNRAEVAQIAATVGVVVLTAEADAWETIQVEVVAT